MSQVRGGFRGGLAMSCMSCLIGTKCPCRVRGGEALGGGGVASVWDECS